MTDHRVCNQLIEVGEDAAFAEQGAYDILSDRIEWTDLSDRWVVADNEDNVLTKRTNQLCGGPIYGEPAPDGASLRLRSVGRLAKARQCLTRVLNYTCRMLRSAVAPG